MTIWKKLTDKRVCHVRPTPNGCELLDGASSHFSIQLAPSELLALSTELRLLATEEGDPPTPVLDAISKARVFALFSDHGQLIVQESAANHFEVPLDLNDILQWAEETEQLAHSQSSISRLQTRRSRSPSSSPVHRL